MARPAYLFANGIDPLWSGHREPVAGPWRLVETPLVLDVISGGAPVYQWQRPLKCGGIQMGPAIFGEGLA